MGKQRKNKYLLLRSKISDQGIMHFEINEIII